MVRDFNDPSSTRSFFLTGQIFLTVELTIKIDLKIAKWLDSVSLQLGNILDITYKNYSSPQLYINYLWFELDTVIVIQLCKYRKNEFSNLSSLTLGFIFVVSIATAFSIILLGGSFLSDVDGVYTPFGQNLLMSVLIVVMFFSGGNLLRGQSIFIAIFKMLGTGLTGSVILSTNHLLVMIIEK